MKILILNGSPKRDKSDTMHVTRAFVDGMNAAGENEVTVIDVIDSRIEYCRGCFTCMHNGGTCVIDDDMKDILNTMVESDVLIFSFPLYNYGMPAPLKALMDRTLPLSSMAMRREGDRYMHVRNADHSNLRFVMICGCGFPNSKGNFEPMVSEFKLMFPYGRTIITMPECPMFNAPDAKPATEPKLELVRQAGRIYAETGEIPEGLLEKVCAPMIPEEVYASIVNSGV